MRVLSAGPPFAGAESIAGIALGMYRSKRRAEIRGSGYVVDSLEAAPWCFDRTPSLREAVLMAANLGDYADTTAAVCGQIAGAHNGRSGIPERWCAQVARREMILGLANRLSARASARCMTL